mgnify:CR=1 FL=1
MSAIHCIHCSEVIHVEHDVRIDRLEESLELLKLLHEHERIRVRVGESYADIDAIAPKLFWSAFINRLRSTSRNISRSAASHTLRSGSVISGCPGPDVAWALATAGPLIWVVLSSFKNNTEIFLGQPFGLPSSKAQSAPFSSPAGDRQAHSCSTASGPRAAVRSQISVAVM